MFSLERLAWQPLTFAGPRHPGRHARRSYHNWCRSSQRPRPPLRGACATGPVRREQTRLFHSSVPHLWHQIRAAGDSSTFPRRFGSTS